MATDDEIQNYYLPTTLDTKINLRAYEINANLEDNIKRAVERKYGNRFFSFGHVRPGTIQILKRSIGHKIGSSDFTGNISFDVIFQCEIYLPQIGQEIDARVKSINKIGILAKSDSNKLTILLSKPHQTNLELFGEVMLESRIRAKIMDFKIDGQNETIVIIGDLTKILTGVYQNYQLPRIDGMRMEIQGNLQPTSNIRNIYLNYGDFIDSVNSKSLMDPYAMFVPDQYNQKTWNQIRTKGTDWQGFKDYWRLVRSIVEDFELVHPSGGYNQNKGIAVLPLKARPISRAYFKLWELLHRYPGITNQIKEQDQAVILCLGEAPGGFLQSLTHYRFKEHSRSNDVYYGYSLEAESVSLSWDNPLTQKELFRLQNNQINLNYADLTRVEDLMRMIEDLTEQQTDGKLARRIKADIITADAAYTHTKVYNYEEVVNYRIFFGEIVAALLNQKIGGSFVLKIFDILTRVSQQFLILLNHYYSEVFVTKPDFSRPASSEKFVVCLGFRGLTTNSQSEKDVTRTLFELMDLWTEKISERTDIFYPENEIFLLNLLEYNIGDEDDFSRKLQEITHDHITKQSEHVNRGIHLIHTRTIFQQRKVEQLKENQIRQAVNWCQRYKLEYNEDLPLSQEEFIDTGIVNTTRTLTYQLKTLLKDHQETYEYLKDNYQYANLEYIKKRSLSLNQQLEQIYQDYQSGEIYEFKVSRLDPTPALNGELASLSGGRSNRWYVIYELLNQLSIKSSTNTFKAFVNLDSITVDATQALVDYFELNYKGTKLDWTGYVIRQQDVDPTGWFSKHRNQWLMNQIKDDSQQTSPSVRSKTLKLIQQHFATANRQVDFYLSDFHLPLSNESYGVLIPYPERYFLRDYLGQILAGLFSLKNGGDLLMRQYTFFEDLTISLMALVEDLFDQVTIVKPMVGQTESSEVYVFAQGFQSKKFTSKMQTDLLNYLSDEIPESREELMEQEDLLLSQLPESCKIGPKEIEQLKSKLIYVGYRIYVLNQFPRLQINLDLYHNTRYQLNSQQDASVRHLLGEKEEIANKSTLGPEDQAELSKLNQQVEEQFSEVTERIVMEDFRYLLEQTVTNWLDQNKIG